MKRCVLDGSRFDDAGQFYRALADAFGLPDGFRARPDALSDALGVYAGQPVAVIWRHAARSAQLLGPRFAEIVAVLQRAAADGRLTLELA